MLDQHDAWLLTITSSNQLMAINTFINKCFVYKKRSWIFHGDTPGYIPRMMCSLSEGTCVASMDEIHLLGKDSSNWVTRKFVQESSIEFGLPISDNEIIILRGNLECHENLEKLNLDTMKIEPFVKLKIPRRGPAICLYKDNLFVTGGLSEDFQDKLVSTEIISLNNSSVLQSPDMNISRAIHSMGIVRMKSGKQKLIVFGGDSDDTRMEEWNEEQKKWQFSKLKVSTTKPLYSYCYKYRIY